MKKYCQFGKDFDRFMMTGISTACLYPLITEEALKTLISIGVESVELFVNCNYEISPSMLREIRAIADGSGVKILSLHPWHGPIESIMCFSRYERRFQEGLELYKKYYQAANMLGAELVVFHGGARAAGIEYAEYFDRFGRMVEDSIANGSCLCQENVSRCTSWSPDFFREMAKALPDAEFVFDIKQAIRAGADVFEFAEAMAGRIKHVHFSDNDEAHDCLPPGKGTFNTREFLSLITKNGFDGGVIVELYRENFGEIVELSQGYQHLFTYVSTALKNAEKVDPIRHGM